MGILVLAGLIAIVLFALHRHGKRVAEQMGIDSETTSLDEATRVRFDQRRAAEKLKATGRAMGDPKLGDAMAKTFMDMTAMCPECKGLVDKEADACGHCGYPLRGSGGVGF